MWFCFLLDLKELFQTQRIIKPPFPFKGFNELLIIRSLASHVMSFLCFFQGLPFPNKIFLLKINEESSLQYESSLELRYKLYPYFGDTYKHLFQAWGEDAASTRLRGESGGPSW